MEFEIRRRSGEWGPSISALVDSGADYILLPRSFCTNLGYRWREGKRRTIQGIGKKSLTARMLDLPVRLGADEFEAPIAFTYADTTPQLLGREGIFSRFNVLFAQRTLRGHFVR